MESYYKLSAHDTGYYIFYGTDEGVKIYEYYINSFHEIDVTLSKLKACDTCGKTGVIERTCECFGFFGLCHEDSYVCNSLGQFENDKHFQRVLDAYENQSNFEEFQKELKLRGIIYDREELYSEFEDYMSSIDDYSYYVASATFCV